MGIGLNIGGNLSQGYASGGSTNSAQSSGQGISQNDADQARAFSAQQANIAYERQKELMQMEMNFNREEAQKARDWNERMSNSIYTRSAQNMKEAGINPILAANMGLSGASVSSGQTASIGGASAPMAQTAVGTSSEWNNQSTSEGQSWNKSEQGLLTALSGLGEVLGKALGSINSAMNLNINLDGLKNSLQTYDETVKKIPEASVTKSITDLPKVKDVKDLVKWTLNELNPLNGPTAQTLRNNHTATIYEVGKDGKKKKVYPKD